MRALWLLLALSLPVQADLYKHVDANGRVTYTNLPLPGAKQLPADTPAPRRASPAAPTVPAAAAPLVQRPVHAATPAHFPRIKAEVQRARDKTRRRILSDELAHEQQLVVAARQALSEANQAGKRESPPGALQERLLTHQKNVEALRKELARIR